MFDALDYLDAGFCCAIQDPVLASTIREVLDIPSADPYLRMVILGARISAPSASVNASAEAASRASLSDPRDIAGILRGAHQDVNESADTEFSTWLALSCAQTAVDAAEHGPCSADAARAWSECRRVINSMRLDMMVKIDEADEADSRSM